MKKPRVSIIIPAHNEAATIARVIEAVHRLPLEKEVVVIDDGSRDETPRILSQLQGKLDQVRRLEPNQGKGSALRKGIELASGDIIAFQDADLELDPACLPRLVEPILAGRTGVVFGSRFLGHPWKWTRGYLANRFLTALTNLLYGSKLTDMETCYKLGRADIFKSLPLSAKRFDIEPEITAWLIRSGHQIHEVSVVYTPRTRSEGKHIGWRDGLAAIWTLLRIRLTLRP